MKLAKEKTKHLLADVCLVLLLPQPYSYPEAQPDWKFPEGSHITQKQ
jgi:hypothetical protein